MTLLNVSELKLGYDGRTIVDNVSFSVADGDFLCIVGENGTGKTTLMKGILGLIPKQSGVIEYREGLSQSHIGYLSQRSEFNRDFPASVYEVVMSGFLNNRRFALRYSKSEKQRAVENMKKVGISEISKKSFSELSGGQQQRVLLARALCAAKRLILLDEPTSSLDPIVTSEFYSLIHELNREGIAIIMVSHDVSASVRNASHILHLSTDSFFFGTTHEYMHSEFGDRLLISDCPCDACRHNHRHTGGGCDA